MCHRNQQSMWWNYWKGHTLSWECDITQQGILSDIQRNSLGVQRVLNKWKCAKCLWSRLLTLCWQLLTVPLKWLREHKNSRSLSESLRAHVNCKHCCYIRSLCMIATKAVLVYWLLHSTVFCHSFSRLSLVLLSQFQLGKFGILA